ncbi:hypothetical protein C0995_002144 [Termitomyces sp. Mi166|nr:hypothetical protein C0995_002144 [Termitomyces sp. Mi166\
MAPTIQNSVEHPGIVDSKDAQHLTPSAESFQRARAYVLHRQRSPSKLWRHQNRAETVPSINPDMIQNSEPYTSSIPLHAKIIPHTMTTSQSNTSRFGHLSITEVVLISLAALMVIVVGVAALVMMRSIIIKKVRRLLRCGCGGRQARKNKAMAEDNGALVMGDEFDDPAWGTRLVYVEGLHDRLEECHSPCPLPSPDALLSSPLAVVSRAPSMPTSPRLSTACEDDSFQGRLEYEEHDITLALTRALRDATDEPDFDTASLCSNSSLRYLNNSSILDSLQASIDNLAKSVPSSSSRPRQYSDASTSSQATTAVHSDCANFFSVSSPTSSITSLESTKSSLDEGPEEMEDMVYEVRRVHAQGLELKKAVLVTCRRTSSTGDITTPGMLPTFVVSEAPPSLMPLEDLNFAPLFSLSNSMPSKASLSGCTTTPSWSSIVRENSRGTMASLSSSSTTAMDGWTQDDERHLHPPIPLLMLTRPSDSSIHTAESFASSVSVDLCDFPSPPLPAKPSYYSKLVDQVQRAPKRIWDNHSVDSSVAQKISTVERFIMMYSKAYNILDSQPDETMRTIERSQNTIHRVGSHLIQENKRKLQEAETNGSPFLGKDFLSLLMKSNASTDLPPEHRISDEDILHNINTFMFAGSDTTSLSVTWTLLLLAQHPELQARLRKELLSVAPSSDLASLTEDEIHSLYDNIANLPFLNNVCRESLRLVPPVHSSIRVATQDDEVPTSYPVHRRDGTIDEGRRSVTVPKGSFVHVAVEGFNLDKGIWGEDAWEFRPDRWDNLSETAAQQPGLYSNTLTFSAGPRSCIGMRFALIEFKIFLYILITNFVFKVTDEKILKANVVVTRPYVSGKYKEGSQCPLLVSLYVPPE